MKIASAAIGEFGVPVGADKQEMARMLSVGSAVVELPSKMGSKTLTSLFPSEGFAVLRGSNVTGFFKAFGPFFDDKSVSYSLKGPDAAFARAEVSDFFGSFYVPDTIFRDFSFENLRVERTYAGDQRKHERYFVFFGNPGKGGRPGPKSGRSMPPLAFEPGPFHKGFPLRIETVSGEIVDRGAPGEFVCGDFDPK